MRGCGRSGPKTCGSHVEWSVGRSFRLSVANVCVFGPREGVVIVIEGDYVWRKVLPVLGANSGCGRRATASKADAQADRVQPVGMELVVSD